jgi:hypothetical protein
MSQVAQEEIDGDDSFSNLGVGALLLFQSEIEVNRLLKQITERVGALLALLARRNHLGFSLSRRFGPRRLWHRTMSEKEVVISAIRTMKVSSRLCSPRLWVSWRMLL